MTDEEARAAAYRAQERRRERFARTNAVAMRGKPVAATALRAAWEPLVLAIRERNDREPEPVERHDRHQWDPA